VDGFPSCQAFTGFGPHALSPGAVPPLYVIEGKRPSRLRVRVKQECPRRPGVYGMVDEHGELIYVGKAKCLRSRLLSYFRPHSRDPKAGHILEDAAFLVWECVPSEFAALLRELELIRRWRPRFNVQGQPRRHRRAYVCVGRRPAPYVFLAPRPPTTALACYGPVPAGETARAAVRRVNDWYRLRDCPQAQEMVFAEQGELFPVVRTPGCIRHEIGCCLGPCAAICTRAEYAVNVRAARAFLEGADAAPVETTERDMAAASAALEFERAAALRDKLDALRWLSEHLERLRRAAADSFVYPVRGYNGAETWYLIHRGRAMAALPAPRDPDSRQTVAAALEAVYSLACDVSGLPTPEEIDGVWLVSAWFRRFPDERRRTLEQDAARAACMI
jgi:excinuclease ABC subunit C